VSVAKLRLAGLEKAEGDAAEACELAAKGRMILGDCAEILNAEANNCSLLKPLAKDYRLEVLSRAGLRSTGVSPAPPPCRGVSSRQAWAWGRACRLPARRPRLGVLDDGGLSFGGDGQARQPLEKLLDGLGPLAVEDHRQQLAVGLDGPEPTLFLDRNFRNCRFLHNLRLYRRTGSRTQKCLRKREAINAEDGAWVETQTRARRRRSRPSMAAWSPLSRSLLTDR